MSIVIKNISKVYGTQKALDNVSLSIGEGEIVGLLGPNGAGKSTMMKILTCFIPPTEGSAEICGYDIFEHQMEIKRSVGYLSEQNPLYYDMYVRGNIADKVVRHKGAVCFESGYVVYDNHKNYTSMRNRHVLFKLSGYLECGLNQIMSNREVREMYTINSSNPAELTNKLYYLSNSTRSKRTLPFVVGVRWTYTLATITCRTCK